jgi:Tfp pilus assembly protein PilO
MNLMAIRPLTKREKRIFVVCVALAVVYGVYNGLIRPSGARDVSLDQTIASWQRRLNKDTRVIQKAASLDGLYDFYVDRFKQVKTNEQVMSGIVAEVEEAAGRVQLQISNINPQKVKQGELYNRFSVSLTIEGPFMDIMHFLHLLQGEPHLFDVEEARIEKGAGRQTTLVRAQLVLSKIFIQ